MMVPVIAALLAVAAVTIWPSAPSLRGSRGGSDRRVRHSVAARWADQLRRTHQRLARRSQEEPTTAEVADALVLIALAVRSGLGLAEGLAQVQECSEGAVRRDLAAVVAALGWGRSAAQAWAFAGPSWRPVALAWRVAERTGAPAADLVERAGRRLRDAEDRHAERRAARAGVLLVLPLGLGFLPAFAFTTVMPVVLALVGGVLGA